MYTTQASPLSNPGFSGAGNVQKLAVKFVKGLRHTPNQVAPVGHVPFSLAGRGIPCVLISMYTTLALLESGEYTSAHTEGLNGIPMNEGSLEDATVILHWLSAL